MACIRYLLDRNAMIETLKFSCRFEGNNGTVIADDQ